ncbi:HAD-IA family hydrolase [Glaciecola sp. XM2]|jgi:HAD superfamily hydrolase (TIGR01549 family)|uniref:HAD family hydrolase n=1 Tax=Glaciecola sp. XM2 TaxID=1914931 RepID=UPI001BDED574|nr:HAD-IA family hydrolase [Glaciecola sp. XM2]MBT1451671.1 HAD-IA family hydrolase [Glaciecola sp. XM2]
MFCFTKVKGIIFDLDDTLVHANLNFAEIKAAVGCAPEDDILTHIQNISCAEKRNEAAATVLRYELEDAQTSRLIRGAGHFVERALAAQLPLAIVTRNCQQATQIKLHQNDIPIDTVLTREDAAPKPDPEALLHIASMWRNERQFELSEIAYIGDYKYDIEAAHNAGMQAWLYTYCATNIRYEDGLRYISKSESPLNLEL